MTNTYYFTFGVGHPYKDYVQPIMSNDSEAARGMMFEAFADKWCGQYDESGLARINTLRAERHFPPCKLLPLLQVYDDVCL